MAPQISKRRIFSVFLSSTGADLHEEREAVYEAINRMRDCKCIRMEDFAAEPIEAHMVCRNEVQQSDFFVGLTAFRYGDQIDPEDEKSISYTEHEYESALEADLPILMHVAPDNFREAVYARQDDKMLKRQLEFRERIKKKTMACSPQAWANNYILAAFVVDAVRRRIEDFKLS